MTNSSPLKISEDIDDIVGQIIVLLRIGKEEDWVGVFEEARAGLHDDYAAALARLLSMYGGMGSFNDVVLYDGDRPLVRENNELDALRVNLYRLCKGWNK